MKRSALCLAMLVAFAAPSGAAELTETDLAALRYFLSIDDQASVAAEIERLETEFPGADVEAALALIDAEAAQIDPSPIWRRIEADDFAGARALIAETREANPDWTPPEEMLAVLDGREGQARFEAAFAAGDLAGALEALGAFPAILTCERVNNPWRLAELQIAGGLAADALKTYEGVLTSCRSEDQVVATLQKASAVAEPDALAALFAVARSGNPGLLTRLAALEAELTAGIVAPEGDGAPAPAAVASTRAAPAASAAPAAASRGADAAAASAPSPAASPAGLSRARAAADRGDWAGCLDATTGARSVEEVNQRAWCALNYGRAREAIEAFRRVAAGAGDPAMARDATYGMILGHSKLGQLEQAAALARQVDLTGAQRQIVNRTVISELAVASFNAGRYRTTLDYLDRLSRESGTLDRGLAMLRGWALLKSGNRSAARDQFRRVHAASPGEDSLQGIIEAR